MVRVDELGPKNISWPQLRGTPFYCTEEEWSERNHFLPHLSPSLERGGGRRRKRKKEKKSHVCTTSNTVQILNFPGSKPGLTFKVPFPFLSSLWFRNRQFWVVCFLMLITQDCDTPQSSFRSMEFIQKSRFHGSPYSNESNIHDKVHGCFPGITFSATSWCFHTYQTPSHPANYKKNTVRSRKERRGPHVITTAPKTTHSAQAGRAAGRTWNATIKDLASFKCSLITLILLSFFFFWASLRHPRRNSPNTLPVSSYHWDWFWTPKGRNRHMPIWGNPCHHPSRMERRWIDCLFWIQYGCITNLILCNPYCCLMGYMLLFPFYRRGNWSSEKLNALLNGTYLFNRGSQIKTWGKGWIPKSLLCLPYQTASSPSQSPHNGQQAEQP